jgi:hypothetical protein
MGLCRSCSKIKSEYQKGRGGRSVLCWSWKAFKNRSAMLAENRLSRSARSVWSQSLARYVLMSLFPWLLALLLHATNLLHLQWKENTKRLAKWLSHQVTQCSYGRTFIPSVECVCPAVTKYDCIFSDYSIKIITKSWLNLVAHHHTMFCNTANKRFLGYDCL